MKDNLINNEILDVIGIGIGPFNLGLAALLQPIPEIKYKFFDNKDAFVWHEGMLLEDTYLQVPFMADLTTMVDPTNPYSYLNFLKENDRLYNFYFYENFKVPRLEYNRYCQWVAHELSNLYFSHHVKDIHEDNGIFYVTVKDLKTNSNIVYKAKNLVLGVGTSPYAPSFIEPFLETKQCIHSSQYLFHKKMLQEKKSITVIGGGQSAAECFLDLLKDNNRFDYKLNWLTRSSGFLPMEYSKLGLEHFSPDYIEHFYHLSADNRQKILASQGNWYKGISFSTIKEIYDLLYLRSIDNGNKSLLQACSELVDIEDLGGFLDLSFKHTQVENQFTLKTDIVVFATGYKYSIPNCFDSLRNKINFNADGYFNISRNYIVETKFDSNANIFIQNGEMHTHGITSSDLGLGPYRSSVIINTILGREYYKISKNIVFQKFGINAEFDHVTI
ncbi:MAG: lysine N(6)-hydroxylase/L-ornithine N(5)-oxygenase family protein [Acinetobacter tjernbergiae]